MKKINSIILAGTMLMTLLSGCNGQTATNVYKDDVFTITNSSEILNLKTLASVEAESSTNTKEFIYTINNGDATYEAVTLALAFKDSTDCSAYVTGTLDLTNKKVTLTCLQAFSQQIIVTLTCTKDTSIKATVTVDYRKKLSTVKSDSKFGVSSYLIIDDYSTIPTTLTDDSINAYFLSLLTKTYSIGTLDYNSTLKCTWNKDFNFGVDDSELHGHASNISSWSAYKSNKGLVNGYLHSDSIALEDLPLSQFFGMFTYLKANDSNSSDSTATEKISFYSTITITDSVYTSTLKLGFVDTWYKEASTTVTTNTSGIEF